MFKRIINISKSRSFFLFGPRGTGKSTFLKTEFPQALYIDLLDPDMDHKLAQDPNLLLRMVEAQSPDWVVIDEIQRNPRLLDIVHILSGKNKTKFAMTGSSARKVRRGAANLLAGRASQFVCNPLTVEELSEAFELPEILRFGSLPEVVNLPTRDKIHFLRAYVNTYFKEEIVAEQIVRKLRPFQNFLQVAAQMNGKILNINKIARDVGVEHTTIQSYFQVLEDTLVGFFLEPFHESVRKRQRKQSKFYFFDTGVVRALRRTLENDLIEGTSEYGEAFEHFVILELRRLITYRKPDWQMFYLSTKDDAEIDLIIDRPGAPRAAIEIKSTKNIKTLSPRDITTFKSLTSSLKNCEAFLVSQDPIEQQIEHIKCLPWPLITQALKL
ncbi:MAG: ATP-binding protein [Bdellovibrionaceae bacterium]|nr:ATP-binding protein [Pseudobdellovibrionaceae bacterium]